MVTFEGKRTAKPDLSEADTWVSVTCGHCSRPGQALVVARPSGTTEHNESKVRWLWCTNCGEPLVRDESERIWPDAPFGPSVEGISDPGIREGYDEARKCMGIGAYNAAEMMCRKLLMAIAVDKEAEEGQSFVSYLDHLEGKGYITPPMKGWVDLIRQNANETTHRLPSPSRERAESTVMFVAELLRLVYEMEYMAEKHQPALEEDGQDEKTQDATEQE